MKKKVIHILYCLIIGWLWTINAAALASKDTISVAKTQDKTPSSLQLVLHEQSDLLHVVDLYKQTMDNSMLHDAFMVARSHCLQTDFEQEDVVKCIEYVVALVSSCIDDIDMYMIAKNNTHMLSQHVQQRIAFLQTMMKEYHEHEADSASASKTDASLYRGLQNIQRFLQSKPQQKALLRPLHTYSIRIAQLVHSVGKCDNFAHSTKYALPLFVTKILNSLLHLYTVAVTTSPSSEESDVTLDLFVDAVIKKTLLVLENMVFDVC